MTTIARTLIAALTISMASTARVRADERIVVDEVRGFTLVLPAGFEPIPDLVDTGHGIVHAFVLGDPSEEDVDMILFIEDLGGTIGRERLRPEDLPAGFQGRLRTMRWDGFDLDAFEVPEELDDMRTITYKVQVPLKHTAIQVSLLGAADRDAETWAMLGETLSGLSGESNWIRSALPSTPATTSKQYGRILLGFTIAFILGGLIVLWFISRVTPRGTVLVIAALLFIVGTGLGGIRVREVMVLSGALRMTALAGGILGIIDLLRQRRPKRRGGA